MRTYYIPDGEVGTVNYWTKKALDRDEDIWWTVMQISDTPNLVLNVIYNMKQHAGAEKALDFAMEVIKFNEKE